MGLFDRIFRADELRDPACGPYHLYLEHEAEMERRERMGPPLYETHRLPEEMAPPPVVVTPRPAARRRRPK